MNLTSPGLSGVQVVTLSVYLLGGAARRVETEDIAVKSHELAPERFSWAKYPGQINLELVRVYLSDAKKAAKGALLSGSGAKGWSLTRAGLSWATTAANSHPRVSGAQPRSGVKSPSSTRFKREKERIHGSAAWASWLGGSKTIDAMAARVVFRIDGYADLQLREAKVTRLLALFVDDPEMQAFLTVAAESLLGAEAN